MWLHVTYHGPPGFASPFTGVRCLDEPPPPSGPFLPQCGTDGARIVDIIGVLDNMDGRRCLPAR